MDHLTNLLVSARDGDRRALERFVAETQGDVWRVCRYLGDVGYTDDLGRPLTVAPEADRAVVLGTGGLY